MNDPQVFYPDPENLPEESKTMTAEEFLSRGRLLMKQIEAKNDQILQLDSLAKRITSSWGQEAVSRSRNITAREEIIARLMDKEAELQKDIQRLLEVRDEIEQMISRIRNPKIRLVLEKYYLCNMNWEEIAIDMKHNIRSMMRLGQQGMGIIQTEMNRQAEKMN